MRVLQLEDKKVGDNVTLNFIKEVCVLIQKVSMDFYIFVKDTINIACGVASYKFSV